MGEDMRHTGGPEAKIAFLLPFLLSLCFLLDSQTRMVEMAMRMQCAACLVYILGTPDTTRPPHPHRAE